MTKLIKIAPQSSTSYVETAESQFTDSGFLSAVTRLDTVATFTFYLSQASVEMSEKKIKTFQILAKLKASIFAKI